MIALSPGASEAERLAAIGDWQERWAAIGALIDVRGPEFETWWKFWARDGQQPADSDWRVWLMLAGRGFGKTRAGAEWVRRLRGAQWIGADRAGWREPGGDARGHGGR